MNTKPHIDQTSNKIQLAWSLGLQHVPTRCKGYQRIVESCSRTWSSSEAQRREDTSGSLPYSISTSNGCCDGIWSDTLGIRSHLKRPSIYSLWWHSAIEVT